MNLEANIKRYLDGVSESDGRRPDARYASFDYCFNYFQSFREARDIAALASSANLQLSCLHLGFYLASWGMLRGSAELLQRSARHLVPLVEFIAKTDPVLWNIDADRYTDANVRRLLDVGDQLCETSPGMSDILVTKIMLGVFGSVPAFDTNFKKGFRVSTFGQKSLRKIAEYYRANRSTIDAYCVPTLDFITAQPTQHCYTRAKVIDMAFFIEGMGIA